MTKKSSWGRLGRWDHEVRLLNRQRVLEQLKSKQKGIAYGMGRSYGDVCLNPNGVLWETTALDCFLSFNEKTGRLVCEAGVLLRDIQRALIPRGWMLPVTPGTQIVTVGGAIANDVHGKNHHKAGSFGHHVHRLKLMRTNGQIIECGPNLLPEWFSATIGGIGLTGVILEAEIQLISATPWLTAETLPYESLEEFFQLVHESDEHWAYTVSWVDCLAKNNMRGIFVRANPTSESNLIYKERKWSMPLVPPISLINSLSLRVFNSLYFYLKKNQIQQTGVYYESFFYPLDHVLNWNRIYGPKGFYQYQTLLPFTQGEEAVKTILQEIAAFNEGSFLTVLKTFGQTKSLGMLSFPSAGITLALDFPNRGARTKKLFQRLDAIVREVGGRNYLAKDALMPKDLFEIGYHRLNEFLIYRDPGISSAMSRRLIGE